MTNRSQKSRQRTAICRFSFVIGHWSFGKSFSAVSAVVRKNVAPASRRHLSLDNSFWVNTTFAGWKPAIHFFSRPWSTRMHGEPVELRIADLGLRIADLGLRISCRCIFTTKTQRHKDDKEAPR